MNLEAALVYAERHTLHALVVDVAGTTVAEHYGGGYDVKKAHALYSGTKSFWGVTALAAQADGLLALDERVSATFPAWRDDRHATVTLRELLTLTAGIGFGGLGSAVPSYEKALATPIKDDPGTTFTYGGIPLQVFGAVLAHKLAAQRLTPHEYLETRVLAPLGVHIDTWKILKDGTQPLPTGAFVSAREWLKYGRYILQHRDQLAPCFAGTAANAHYGLGWWLAPLASPPGIVHASGSGGQALYIIPSENAVVVKFGQSNSWKHDAFLKRLLS